MIHNVLAHYCKGKSYSMNGDTYEGLVWLDSTPKPTKEQIDQWINDYRYVPSAISNAQGRLALLQTSKLEQVETYMSHPDTPKEQIILFEYAQVFERNNPVLIELGTALGLTSEQIDDLFILGATL